MADQKQLDACKKRLADELSRYAELSPAAKAVARPRLDRLNHLVTSLRMELDQYKPGLPCECLR